jgi:hypothetical protein
MSLGIWFLTFKRTLVPSSSTVKRPQKNAKHVVERGNCHWYMAGQKGDKPTVEVWEVLRCELISIYLYPPHVWYSCGTS